MNMVSTSMRGLWATALLATLAGCAATPGKPDRGATASPLDSSPSDVAAPDDLAARAERRWQLLIDGKPDQAYDYLSPGYRQTRSREDYAASTLEKPVKWVGVDYQDQDCDGETCKVRLMITYTLDMPVQMVGKVESIDFVTESWLWIDGNWYLLPVAGQQKDLR